MALPASRTGVVARKLGMTRIFNEQGRHVPVTVLSLDGCQVVGLRTDADREVGVNRGKKKEKVTVTRNDGYSAVVMGAGEAKAKRTPKAQREAFVKAGVAPKRKLVELRARSCRRHVVNVHAHPGTASLKQRRVVRQLPPTLFLQELHESLDPDVA